MRRTLLTVGLILVAGVLAWEFVPLQVIIWDGGFDIIVHVESLGGQPQSVYCETFGRHDQAEDVLAFLLQSGRQMGPTVADPFNGQPLAVRVAVSGWESPFGRELCRSQFRYLVVVAQFPDGRRVGTLAELPDGRVARKVSVTLP